MKKLLVLDSNSIINRAFYGIRTLNAPDGTPTNAIYGFINILMKLISDHEPDYILAAFDLKAPTFRHKMYDQYKANRTGMPDELAAQMPIMKDILSQMNIPLLQLEGYEADDIIGTVSRICGEKSIECYIATGDRDDLQLAGNGTTVVLASTKMGRSVTELFDEGAVKEKYGVTPAEFIDLKALMGDKSDNIPGVSGIGEKTAAKLIGQFSTIEKLYDDIDHAEVSDRIKEKLKTERDQAFLSKKLATIDINVPIEINIEAGCFDAEAPEYDPALYTTLMQLGLKSIIKKLGLTAPESTGAAENKDFFSDKKIIVCNSEDELTNALKALGDTISVYFDIKDKKIVSFAASNGTTAVCADHASIGAGLMTSIKPILTDGSIKKLGSDIKTAMTALGKESPINGLVFDCAIAAYLDDPSKSFDIESLAAYYLGVYINDDAGSAQLSLLDAAPASDTPAKYALIIYALYHLLSDKIEKNGQHDLYYNVELPLVNVLSSMEQAGFTLDTEELSRFGSMLPDRIKKLEAEI